MLPSLKRGSGGYKVRNAGRRQKLEKARPWNLFQSLQKELSPADPPWASDLQNPRRICRVRGHPYSSSRK